MQLAWEQTRNDSIADTRIADIGSYRFVVSEEKDSPSPRPVYGSLLHIVQGGTYLLESGQYKTRQTAIAALVRKSRKYNI